MYVTKEVKQKIKLLADQQKTTMTDIIQELLSEELENLDLSNHNADQRSEMLADLEPTEDKPKQKSKEKKSKQN